MPLRWSNSCWITRARYPSAVRGEGTPLEVPRLDAHGGGADHVRVDARGC